MRTRKKGQFLENFKRVAPYILVGGLILALVFVGSLDKKDQTSNLNIESFSTNESEVSVDQMSELYVVADLSDTLRLASASDVASNYVSANAMYDAGQTSTTGKLEKPNLTDISASRGVIEYTVADGETLDTIAAAHGISVDQIRWSNGLRSSDVAPGTVLYLPSTPGIVYLVKPGDSIDSIATKYGSSATEIIALNDLEMTGIVEGTRIIIKDGSLPLSERPEYVAPSYNRRPQGGNSYFYTYLGSTSDRQNIEVVGYFYNLGGPYAGGWCTQWAWYKRQDLPSHLGNANSWARNAAAAGYSVNRIPSPGSIFQTTSGYYGHVGYVESVNGDGSITVTEMNYGGGRYRVIRSNIPASSVGNFFYIH